MTEDNIEIIRELLKAGWTVKKIAEKLGSITVKYICLFS